MNILDAPIKLRTPGTLLEIHAEIGMSNLTFA